MQNYLFLDIEGVITSQRAYEALDVIPEIEKFTDKEITSWNKLGSSDLGLFCREGNWGEIYSKNRVKALSQLCQEYDMKVVIVSSGCNAFDLERKDYWCKYWSELWNMDVVDMYCGSGSLKWRIAEMMVWLDDNCHDNFQAKLLDDLIYNDNDDLLQYVAFPNNSYRNPSVSFKDTLKGLRDDYKQGNVLMRDVLDHYCMQHVDSKFWRVCQSKLERDHCKKLDKDINE